MTSHGRAIGWLLFVAALALRMGWVVLCWLRDGPQLEFDDERLHWELACNLIHNGELISDDGRYAARMPVYPLFLALFAGLGQTGIFVARLTQALLGAASTLVAYRFANRVLGSQAALLAGLLVCCDPYAIFFANLLLTEIPFVLIGLALTACAWHLATQTKHQRAPLGVALLGSAAVLTRPSAAGWVFSLWLVLWLTNRNRRRSVIRLLIFATIFILLMLPWGIRNRAVLGSYAWLSTNGGVTLYDAQGPQADGSSNQAFLKNMPELANLDEVDRDVTLRRMALEQMKSDPTRVLQLAWTKFRRTWNPIPNFQDYRSGFTALISAVFTGIVLVLATIGTARTVASRRRKTENTATARISGIITYHVLLWLPVVYFTLVHCVFIGSLRYRVPLMPLLALVAATALLKQARQATNPVTHGCSQSVDLHSRDR